MKTTKEKLYYPKNAYYDIFGMPPENVKVKLLPNAEGALENALKTISPQESPNENNEEWNNLSTNVVFEIFMLRYRENMTLREIAKHCGIQNEEIVELILKKTLRLLRHPIRSKNLKRYLEQ